LPVFFVDKIKIKVLFASLNSLNDKENPSRNLLQEACSGFHVALCACKKLFRKPAITRTVFIGENDPKESQNRNSYAAFFRISKFFLPYADLKGNRQK
jgi:hypothetical protein